MEAVVLLVVAAVAELLVRVRTIVQGTHMRLSRILTASTRTPDRRRGIGPMGRPRFNGTYIPVRTHPWMLCQVR